MPKAASAKTIKKALATVNRARKSSRVTCRKSSKKCTYRKGSRKSSRKASRKSSRKASRKRSRKTSKKRSRKSSRKTSRRNSGVQWDLNTARTYLGRGSAGTYQEYVDQCKTARPSDVRAWARADNVYIPASAKNRREVCESAFFSRDMDRPVAVPKWHIKNMGPSSPRWQQLKALAAGADRQAFIDTCNQTGFDAIRRYGRANHNGVSLRGPQSAVCDRFYPA